MTVAYLFSSALGHLPLLAVLIAGFVLLNLRRARLHPRSMLLARLGLGALLLGSVVQLLWSLVLPRLYSTMDFSVTRYGILVSIVGLFTALLSACGIGLLIAAVVTRGSGQPGPGQPGPGQPFAGQPGPGQQGPGQFGPPGAGQSFPGQSGAGQSSGGRPQPGQPWTGQPQPGQTWADPTLYQAPAPGSPESDWSPERPTNDSGPADRRTLGSEQDATDSPPPAGP